jgi:hypothetical protein
MKKTGLMDYWISGLLGCGASLPVHESINLLIPRFTDSPIRPGIAT